MKKVLTIALVLVLLMASLFILTACEKGEGENGNSSNSQDKYYENAETGELNDKWNGLKMKFAYPAGKGYELTQTPKSVEYQKVTLKSKDLNSTITLKYSPVDSNEIEKRKENYDKDTSKYTEYAEIEFAGYKGYTVNYTDYSGTKKTGLLMLCKNEAENTNQKEKWYAFEFTVEKSSTSSSAAEFDAVEYYNSEDFQNLLNSIQFEKVDPIDVGGVIGANRDLAVKELKAPSDDYTVYQAPETNGIMNAYMLKDGKYNGSGAYFRVYNQSNIDKEKFATLDKVLEYYQGGTWNYTFTDDTIADLKVKVEHNPKGSSSSEKYSVWKAGYFEKDGKVFNFLYYVYEDVPTEIGEQLIKDVIANMFDVTEE